MFKEDWHNSLFCFNLKCISISYVYLRLSTITVVLNLRKTNQGVRGRPPFSPIPYYLRSSSTGTQKVYNFYRVFSNLIRLRTPAITWKYVTFSIDFLERLFSKIFEINAWLSIWIRSLWFELIEHPSLSWIS